MHICSSFNALASMHVCLHDCFLALLPLKAILNHFCSSTVSTAASLHSSNFHWHDLKLPILQRRNRNNSACYVRTSRSAFFIYMMNLLIWKYIHVSLRGRVFNVTDSVNAACGFNSSTDRFLSIFLWTRAHILSVFAWLIMYVYICYYLCMHHFPSTVQPTAIYKCCLA